MTKVTYSIGGDGLIRSFAYSYDASSLITQQVVTADGQAVTNAYAYDGLGRLVSESFAQSGTNALTHFSYDLAGNRLSVSSEFSVVTNVRSQLNLSPAKAQRRQVVPNPLCVLASWRESNLFFIAVVGL